MSNHFDLDVTLSQRTSLTQQLNCSQDQTIKIEYNQLVSAIEQEDQVGNAVLNDYGLHRANFNQDILYSSQMNKLELAYIFEDDYKFLRLRKMFMISASYISLICFKIIKNKLFEAVSLSVIIINSLFLVTQDPQDLTQGVYDDIFLGFYTIEMFLKIAGLGFLLNKGSYLRDYWNILDFVIVTSAYIPLLINSSSINLSSLRSLRILRPLRTISSIKSLKLILLAFFSSFRMLCDTFLVLIFVFLIFAIAGLQLFQGLLKKRCFHDVSGIETPDEGILCGNYDCPSDGKINYICGKTLNNPYQGVTNFDNILYSFLQVYEVATLENWTTVQTQMRYVYSDLVIIYFTSIVFICAFFLLNIVLAVIKGKFTDVHNQSIKNTKIELQQELGDQNPNQYQQFDYLKLIQKEKIAKGEFFFSLREINMSKKYSQHFRQQKNERKLYVDHDSTFSPLKEQNYPEFQKFINYRNQDEWDNNQNKKFQANKQERMNKYSSIEHIDDEVLSFNKNRSLHDSKEGDESFLSLDHVQIREEIHGNFAQLSQNSQAQRQPQQVQNKNKENIHEEIELIDQIEQLKQKLLIEQNPNHLKIEVRAPDQFNFSSQNDVMYFTLNKKNLDKLILREQYLKKIKYIFSYKLFTEEVKEKTVPQKREKFIILPVSFKQAKKRKLWRLASNKNQYKIKQSNNHPNQNEKQQTDQKIPDNYEVFRIFSLNLESYTLGRDGVKLLHQQRQFRDERRKEILEFKELNLFKAQKILYQDKNEVELDILVTNDFEQQYRYIREIDHTNFKISKYNWSSQDVISNQVSQSHKKQNYILHSLMNPDVLIWMKGINGFIAIFRKLLRHFVSSMIFEQMIIICVILNTLVLCMDGVYLNVQWLSILSIMNLIFTIIFTIEMVLKITGYGLQQYTRDIMNLFDGIIVIMSLVELIFISGGNKAISGLRVIRILRTFRVLRVAKLLRALSFMQVIIKVVSKSISSFFYITLLLFLLIFIYSLLGRQLFKGNLNLPQEQLSRSNFETLHQSLITVFQLLTMSNWNDIMNVTIRSSVGPFISIIYIFSWFFVGNYCLLNLFLAILLDGFSGGNADEEEEEQILVSKKNQQEDDEKKAEGEQITKQCEDLKENDIRLSDIDYIDISEQEKHKKNDKSQYMNIPCQFSLYIFSKQNWLRRCSFYLVTYKHFESLILLLIITSSLKLVYDTYIPLNPQTYGEKKMLEVSFLLDYIFNTLFATEMVLKIITYGLSHDNQAYLKDSWNRMDFCIVCISLLDMALVSINIPAIKILKLLRILRPLRFLSHNKNLRLVVTALFSSIGGILNVSIVIFLIFLIFSILGVSLMQNKFGHCNVSSYYGISQQECLDSNQQWIVFPFNFDNVKNGLITLFILGSLEDWNYLLYYALDSDDPQYGPSLNNNYFLAIFYIVFILIGSFFFLNLFIGTICYHFDQSQQKDKKINHIFLTEEQVNWVQTHQMIIGVQPDYSLLFVPSQKWRLQIYYLVTSNKFEIFMMIFIGLNIFNMAIAYEGSSLKYRNTLEFLNYSFTGVFITELLLKLMAFGFKGYWISSWNKFDLFVVLASILDIIINNLSISTSQLLIVGPQIARVIRVFRVTRLFKLVKSFEGLQKIIATMIISLPSLVNVGALLFLCIFIYAILGWFLFNNIPQGDYINRIHNCQNFHNCFILLFKCSTGEDWPYYMQDFSNYSIWAVPFFTSYILICSYIMTNLFILIIIQDFEEYNIKANNPLEEFKRNFENFKQIWNTYSKEYSGLRMHSKSLFQFFTDLKPPLGIGKNDRCLIAQRLINLNMSVDEDNCIYFNELLYEVIKLSFGNDLGQTTTSEFSNFLKLKEMETKKELKAQNKQIYLLVKGEKGIQHNEDKKLNPFFQAIFVRMVFLSWKRYKDKLNEELREKQPNQYEYFKQRYMNEITESEDDLASLNQEIIYEEAYETYSPKPIKFHIFRRDQEREFISLDTPFKYDQESFQCTQNIFDSNQSIPIQKIFKDNSQEIVNNELLTKDIELNCAQEQDVSNLMKDFMELDQDPYQNEDEEIMHNESEEEGSFLDFNNNDKITLNQEEIIQVSRDIIDLACLQQNQVSPSNSNNIDSQVQQDCQTLKIQEEKEDNDQYDNEDEIYIDLQLFKSTRLQNISIEQEENHKNINIRNNGINLDYPQSTRLQNSAKIKQVKPATISLKRPQTSKGIHDNYFLQLSNILNDNEDINKSYMTAREKPTKKRQSEKNKLTDKRKQLIKSAYGVFDK